MVNSKLIILFFTLILWNFINCVDSKKIDKKAEKRKAQLNKFMKDLHSANNLDDLMGYGIKRNGQLHGGRLKVAAIFGRTNYNGPTQLTQNSNVIDATPGKCDPKPVCISNPLTLNITSTQFAFPPCINIHRCDGCCPTNENCVAIGSHEVELHKVGIISYDGENSPAYDETSVTVSNHTDCQCQCQWKNDEDCREENPNLIRNPQACECICPETLYCDAFHQFDQESCKCKCRQDIFSRLEQNCDFRGFYWNDDSCKCEAVRKNSYKRSVRVIRRNQY